MSESLSPLPQHPPTSHNPHTPHPHVQPGGLPPDATFDLLRRPRSDHVVPIREGSRTAGQILGERTVLLVSIHQTKTNDWWKIRGELIAAKELGVPTLLVVGHTSDDEIASGLYCAGQLCERHDIAQLNGDGYAFVPNAVLADYLGIGDGMRVKNALVLMRGGRVAASWVARTTGEAFHWSPIIAGLGFGQA